MPAMPKFAPMLTPPTSAFGGFWQIVAGCRPGCLAVFATALMRNFALSRYLSSFARDLSPKGGGERKRLAGRRSSCGRSARLFERVSARKGVVLHAGLHDAARI